MRRRPPRSTRTDTLLPYTTLFRSVTGGLSSPPNNVGVCDRVISRIATRMSGRDPSAWILREPGIGRVTESDSCSVCCSSERSEEHTSELQSLMRISYAVFCLKKKKKQKRKRKQ